MNKRITTALAATMVCALTLGLTDLFGVLVGSQGVGLACGVGAVLFPAFGLFAVHEDLSCWES